jgi:hypothetical protein
MLLAHLIVRLGTDAPMDVKPLGTAVQVGDREKSVVTCGRNPVVSRSRLPGTLSASG